jgi:hypothetical protein
VIGQADFYFLVSMVDFSMAESALVAKPTEMSEKLATLLLSDLTMSRPGEKPVEQTNVIIPDQEV